MCSISPLIWSENVSKPVNTLLQIILLSSEGQSSSCLKCCSPAREGLQLPWPCRGSRDASLCSAAHYLHFPRREVLNLNLEFWVQSHEYAGVERLLFKLTRMDGDLRGDDLVLVFSHTWKSKAGHSAAAAACKLGTENCCHVSACWMKWERVFWGVSWVDGFCFLGRVICWVLFILFLPFYWWH